MLVDTPLEEATLCNASSGGNCVGVAMPRGRVDSIPSNSLRISMAVYKRTGSSFWRCEFQYEGRRVQESTGTTDKTEALAYEARRRDELKAGDGQHNREETKVAQVALAPSRRFRRGVAARVNARARIVGRHIGRPVKARFDIDAAGNPRASLEVEIDVEKSCPVHQVLAVLREQETQGDHPVYIVSIGALHEASETLSAPLIEAIRAFQAGALESAKLRGLAKNRRHLGPPALD